MTRVVCAAFALLAAANLPVAAAADDMVLIPAGPFTMGSNLTDERGAKSKELGSKKPWYLDEHPQRQVDLPAFWIDRYEVTNSRFRRFVIAKGYADAAVPTTWQSNGYVLSAEGLAAANTEMLRHLATEVYRLDRDTRAMDKTELLAAIAQHQQAQDALPVTGVNWAQANAFCEWEGKRLPTETEWEKAARGERGNEFPWGQEWDPGRANSGEGREWPEGVAPVGSYESGRSPYGIHDMAGNVMEWVADWYGPYPGGDYQSQAFGERFKVVRGGGWGGVGHYSISHFFRGAYRFYLDPSSTFVDLGFRCAKDEVAPAVKTTP